MNTLQCKNNAKINSIDLNYLLRIIQSELVKIKIFDVFSGCFQNQSLSQLIFLFLDEYPSVYDREVFSDIPFLYTSHFDNIDTLFLNI